MKRHCEECHGQVDEPVVGGLVQILAVQEGWKSNTKSIVMKVGQIGTVTSVVKDRGIFATFAGLGEVGLFKSEVRNRRCRVSERNTKMLAHPHKFGFAPGVKINVTQQPHLKKIA